MRAVELADLIAALLRDELPDDVVHDAEPEGPLFARVIVDGPSGRFALTVEQVPR